MTVNLADLGWEVSRLGDLLELLARRSRMIFRPREAPTPPDILQGADQETIGRWLDAAAAQFGLEVEPIESQYKDVDQLILRGGPAILTIEGETPETPPRYLAFLKGRRGSARILCPDFSVRSLPLERVRRILCQSIEGPLAEDLYAGLQGAGIPPERLDRVVAAILREQLASVTVGDGWLLRLSPGAPLWTQVMNARLHKPVFTMLAAQTVQQAINVISWYLIGMGVFRGQFEWSWLSAWGLILFSAIPFQILILQAQNSLSISSGSIFKGRLLYGVLKLEPEEIRHQGAGQFLSRVMESSAVEMLALNGGFTAVMALFQTATAVWVLSHGAGGLLHGLLLFVWVLILGLVSWLFIGHSMAWSVVYRGMTNDLVEHMVGHRTRLAQEKTGHWHDEEDSSLSQYLSLTIQQSRVSTLMGFMPRGWILLSIAWLSVPLIAFPQSAPSLAVSLGGIMLAYQALQSMIAGIQSLMGLIIAMQQTQPLFQAAARPRDVQPVVLPEDAPEPDEGETRRDEVVLVARGINFRYREHGRLALENCSVQVRRGERILLEGPSGGGKSTLASVLAGLRTPENGLLLLRGLDQKTIGQEEWRRRITVAPQFQENHVFTGTFAFNLLMGRRWPALPADLREAESICQDLGLGDVLERMPAHFQQMVGESGWQLSHGERSRLFIARALLQNADVMILDESFGALDPENLYRAMRCVLDRAKTVIVIAHP